MKTITHLKIWSTLLILAVLWSGINPASRVVWFLEVVLVFVASITIISTHKKFEFSKTAYTLIFIYLILITVGAHYTYEKVPIENLKEFLGTQRNPHDRITHFAFGFFLYLPLLEVFVRTSKLKHRFWMYFVPLLIIVGFGAIYEIAEWATAMHVDPQNAAAFLGMQGDEWDAQKDMLMNTLGAIVTMIGTIIVNAGKYGEAGPEFDKKKKSF